MATFRVTPLQVGTIGMYRGTFTSDPSQMEELEDFPVLIFLLEGEGRTILVDTGSGDPADPELMPKNVHSIPAWRTPEQRPDRALEAIGVDPASVDTVIMTHLHWDHCYNNHLFPQAEFWVQEDEMRYAVAPAPKKRTTYEAFSIGMVPPWARQDTKWVLVNGECDVCEGVRLVLLPGHTPHIQGVLVDTAAGQILLPSDAVPLYECLEGLGQGNYKISSLCDDPETYHATYDKLRAMAASGVTIVPSHDFATLAFRA